jgi:hypothetical protein
MSNQAEPAERGGRACWQHGSAASQHIPAKRLSGVVAWLRMLFLHPLTKLQELAHQRIHYLTAAGHCCYVTPRCACHSMPVELPSEVQHTT